MTAAVYMGAMGNDGMSKVARNSYGNAHYLAERIGEIPGFKLVFEKPYFNEFVTRCPDASKLMTVLKQEGILGGLPIKLPGEGEIEISVKSAGTDGVLWCTTEMNTLDEMDKLVEILKEFAIEKGKEVAE